MEWISVKDRLPKTNEDVLVTDGAACFVSFVDPLTAKWDFYGVTFWEHSHVIAWMPLPEPPKD